MLGRVLGAVLSLAMPGIAIWQISCTACFLLNLYVGLGGFVVGLIELPILCSCNKYCQIFAQYTRVLGSLWIIRAGIYVGVAAGGFAIYQTQGFKPSTTGMDAPSYLLVPLVLLVLNAVLYLAATYKKEDPPGGAAPKPAAPAPPPGGSVSSMFAGMLGRSAAKAVVANPGAAAAFTAAAAPTLAQQMFGGGAASAGKEASAKSFYDDEESGSGYVAPSVPLNPTPATAPNTRSGLFGGFGGGGAASVPQTNSKMSAAPVTNSKMSSAPAPAPAASGFGEDDVRDINPFMS
jgi:hypothetical protein